MLRMQSSKHEMVLAVTPGISLRSHLLLSPRLNQGQLNVSLGWAESAEKQGQGNYFSREFSGCVRTINFGLSYIYICLHSLSSLFDLLLCPPSRRLPAFSPFIGILSARQKAFMRRCSPQALRLR